MNNYERETSLQALNDDPAEDQVRVMLLSLKAGGKSSNPNAEDRANMTFQQGWG